MILLLHNPTLKVLVALLVIAAVIVMVNTRRNKFRRDEEDLDP